MKEQTQNMESMNQMEEMQNYMTTLNDQMTRYANMGQQVECRRDVSEASRALQDFSQACMKSRDDMLAADMKFHQDAMTALNCITGTLCGMADNMNVTPQERIAAMNAAAHLGDVYARVDGERAKYASKDRIASGIFSTVAMALKAGMEFHKND